MIFSLKVDLSLVPDNQCEAKLKTALNSRQLGVGDRYYSNLFKL